MSTNSTSSPELASERSAAPRTFRLARPQQTRLDLRQSDGRAELVVQIENLAFHPARGCLGIQPFVPDQASWYTVVGERRRDFVGRETIDFRVSIAIPEDVPPQTVGFHLFAIDEADPEHPATRLDEIAIEIAWEPIPIVERMSKWKLALAALLILLVAGGLVGSIYRLLFYVEPTSLARLDEANRAALQGDWGRYWECWSPQGQNKLVYWMAHELRETANYDVRWARDVQLWLPSLGLTLDDLTPFVDPPQAVSAADATELTRDLRRKIELRGRSGKDFFTSVAAWNQYDENDWRQYQQSKKDGKSVADYGEFASFEQMKDSRTAQFQFWPLAKHEVRKSLADNLFLCFAVTYADKTPTKDQAAGNMTVYVPINTDERTLPSRNELPEKPEMEQELKKGIQLTLRTSEGLWFIEDFAALGVKETTEPLADAWVALNSGEAQGDATGIEIVDEGDEFRIDMDLATRPKGVRQVSIRVAPTSLREKKVLFESEFISMDSADKTVTFPVRRYEMERTALREWLLLKDLNASPPKTVHLWRKSSLTAPFNILHQMPIGEAVLVLKRFGYDETRIYRKQIQGAKDSQGRVQRVLHVQPITSSKPSRGERQLRTIPSLTRLPAASPGESTASFDIVLEYVQ